MLRLDEAITLYHGSSVIVEHPDLSLCAPRKDFGRGFYLTTSYNQAKEFAQIVTRRANRRDPDHTCGFGIVSSYRFNPSESLAIKVFEYADAAWLHCIAAHRKGEPYSHLVKELSRFDIITGKVANDQTNATLLAYIAGVYGPLGSEGADEMCIGLLLPDRLDDQACFRTARSLEHLAFLGGERVWL